MRAEDQEKSAEVPRPDKSSWLFAQVVFAILAGAVIGDFGSELLIRANPLSDPSIGIAKLVMPSIAFLMIVTSIARARQLNLFDYAAATIALEPSALKAGRHRGRGARLLKPQ